MSSKFIKALLPIILITMLASLAMNINSEPNLLVITIDTLRADHIGYYGKRDIYTPTLDELCRRGIVFTNTFSQSCITIPSHGTIFTSLYPQEHGAPHNIYRMNEQCLTLAEILHSNGYATAAVTTAILSHRHLSGLIQGFEFYNAPITDEQIDEVFATPVYSTSEFMLVDREDNVPKGFDHKEASEVTDQGIRWLQDHFPRQNKDRFFLWLHYFDPHKPYAPRRHIQSLEFENIRLTDQPRFFSPNKEIEKQRTLYADEVNFTDYHLSRLFRFLKRQGYLDNTLVVLTSDHGENLANHERAFEHRSFLYDEVIHVPLVFYFPSRLPGGRLCNRLVRSMDIMPTVLHYLGIEHEGTNMRGISLDLLNLDNIPDDLLAFSDTGEGMVSVRNENLKIIKGRCIPTFDQLETILVGSQQRIYNLKKDAQEKRPRRKATGKQDERLVKELEAWMNSLQLPPQKHRDQSPSAIELLRNLGYVK